MTESQKSPSPEVQPPGFWRELVNELVFLEERTAHWMLQAADPAQRDLLRLESCLRLTGTIRQTRETADHEYLTCLQCGYEYYARGAITVQPCHVCGGDFFSVSTTH